MRQIECVPTGPWRFYNYALLHARGVSQIFNIMRYDNAFMVRQTDVETLIKSATEQEHISARFSILLCKISDKGITRPGWTYPMLLSTQELEEVKDPTVLYMLYPNFVDFKPPSPLKFSNTFELTGDLSLVLNTMLSEQAIPNQETDAHVIEQAFFEPDKVITVKLRFYSPTKSPEWAVP